MLVGTCKGRTDFILSKTKTLVTNSFELFCAARNCPHLLPDLPLSTGSRHLPTAVNDASEILARDMDGPMFEPKQEKFSRRQKVHPDVTVRDTDPAPVPPDTPRDTAGKWIYYTYQILYMQKYMFTHRHLFPLYKT